MAQTTILAAGTSAATSATVTLAAGAYANLQAFYTGTTPPRDGAFWVYMTTPGNPALDGELNFGSKQTMRLIGPGSWIVTRDQCSVAIGVSADQ